MEIFFHCIICRTKFCYFGYKRNHLVTVKYSFYVLFFDNIDKKQCMSSAVFFYCILDKCLSVHLLQTRFWSTWNSKLREDGILWWQFSEIKNQVGENWKWCSRSSLVANGCNHVPSKKPREIKIIDWSQGVDMNRQCHLHVSSIDERASAYTKRVVWNEKHNIVVVSFHE